MFVIAYGAAYLGLAIFVVAVVARVLMWSRLPMHVRWELYPVAHEGERARHGGSYMEESEWWTKPRHVSKVAEARAMAAEIVFLVAVKEHNPKLWTRTFPFHFGLYLVITCTVLMMAGGALSVLTPATVSGPLGEILGNAVMVFGYAGAALVLIGALGLLQRRLSDPGLRDYTSPADVFNLAFFVLAFGSALVTAGLVDPDFAITRTFVANLVAGRWDTVGAVGLPATLPPLTFVMLSLLLAYIPLTHMSHFVGKYFAYHSIRWNDTPNLRGGPEEKRIQAVLSQPITWAAPHIQGDGKKTWVDAATEEQKK